MATVDLIPDLPSSSGGRSRGMRRRVMQRVVTVHGKPSLPARHLSGLLSLHPWLATSLEIDAIDGAADGVNLVLIARAKCLLAAR